ncbi:MULTISPECIES: TrmO family methyltransferase domain-containing protein [Roseomonadaceae]|uniref:SAM-dependent methyltransferase n=1 Tax=Falsiroseomonas oleicola TaxID=2801474 RepID=A0ABS6H3Q2_9PROT|nr:TrmO family methyltransferase [Roseomonas oleicola]MBU8543307.1 SAM-dependent methyltransferase [Roseomonas oleicola]
MRITPIGTVQGGRAEPLDDGWDAVEAEIALDPAVLGPDAARGLDAFSHVVVVFGFHRLDPEAVERNARHPRGRQDWPRVGILAQRGAPRPNRLGVTTCALLGVDGLVLRLRGLDAVAGSPVFDVKPHMTGFDPRGAVREPDWAREIMAGYW